MDFAKALRTGATWITFAGACIAVSAQVAAATILVRVSAPDGAAVADVVATVTPLDGTPPPAASRRDATMDQLGRRFVPQVLAIRTGTRVDFPNNDTVSHQVYSFSPARRFQLPLYKGEVHPPLTFDTAGLVVLGCNIHDEMVGYIFVTDAPWFGVTGSDGTATMHDVPPGRYRIDLWGPRIADPAASLQRVVRVEGGDPSFAWTLARPLRPRPSPGPRDPDWDY
ncbi:MAG: methylamine utilization protein [Steroidobacteraceae bacterium]